MIFDPSTGDLKPDLLGERVLSAIIELKVTADRLPVVLKVIKEVSATLDSVITLDLVTLLEPGLAIPEEVLAAIEASGFTWRPNAKINMGLGRTME